MPDQAEEENVKCAEVHDVCTLLFGSAVSPESNQSVKKEGIVSSKNVSGEEIKHVFRHVVVSKIL